MVDWASGPTFRPKFVCGCLPACVCMPVSLSSLCVFHLRWSSLLPLPVFIRLSRFLLRSEHCRRRSSSVRSSVVAKFRTISLQLNRGTYASGNGGTGNWVEAFLCHQSKQNVEKMEVLVCIIYDKQRSGWLFFLENILGHPMEYRANVEVT